eukprot:GEMP01006201.1.p1 GENE.GEMP01006201.1~~GEMP01006201.1.p1  ORF type:complete len:1120 (+),score=252.89 GEMP01006201.1:53-3412(+)
MVNATQRFWVVLMDISARRRNKNRTIVVRVSMGNATLNALQLETKGAISARRYVGNLLCTVSDFLVYPWSQSRRLALRYIGKDDIFADVKHWVTEEKMESDELKRVSKDTFFSRKGSSVTSFTVDNTGFSSSVVTTFDQGEVIALPVAETFGRAGAIWRSDDNWGFRDILGSEQLQTPIPERAGKALSACFAGYGNLAVGHTDGVHRWDLNSNKAWPLFSLRKSITAVEKVSEHMYTLAGFDFPNWLYFFDARSPSKPLAKVPLAVSVDGSAVSDLRPFYHLQLHSTSSFTTIVACTLTGLCVLPIRLQASTLDIFGVHIEDTRMYRQNFIRGFGGRANFQGATWHSATDSLWWYMDGDFLFCSQIELDGMQTQKLYPIGEPTPIPKDEITAKIYNWWKGKDNIAFPPASERHLMQREDAIHMQETFTYFKDMERSFSSELEQIELPRNDIFEAAKILGLVREPPVLVEDLGYDERVEDILQSLGAWPLPEDLFPVAQLPLRRHINLHELPRGPVPECLMPVGDTFVLKDLDAPSSSDAQMLRLQCGWGDEPPWKKHKVLELTNPTTEGQLVTREATKDGGFPLVVEDGSIRSTGGPILSTWDGASSGQGYSADGRQQGDTRTSFLDNLPSSTPNADVQSDLPRVPTNNDRAIDSTSSSSLSSDGVDSSDDNLLDQSTLRPSRSRPQSLRIRPITSPARRHRASASSIGTHAASRTARPALVERTPLHARARASSSSSLKQPAACAPATPSLCSTGVGGALSHPRTHTSSPMRGRPTPSASSTSPHSAPSRRSRTPKSNNHAARARHARTPCPLPQRTKDATEHANGSRKKRARSGDETTQDLGAHSRTPTPGSKKRKALTKNDGGSVASSAARGGGNPKKMRGTSDPSRSNQPKEHMKKLSKDVRTAPPRGSRVGTKAASSDARAGGEPKKVRRTSEPSRSCNQPDENSKKSSKDVRAEPLRSSRVGTKTASSDARAGGEPKKARRTSEPSRSNQPKENLKKLSKDVGAAPPPRGSRVGTKTASSDAPAGGEPKTVRRTSEPSRSSNQPKENVKKLSKAACSVPPRSSHGGKTARGRTKDSDGSNVTASKRIGRISNGSTSSRGVDTRIRDALKEKKS